MAVAARVIGDSCVHAVLAALHMTAERRGTTGFDRRHHLQLGETDVASVGLPVGVDRHTIQRLRKSNNRHRNRFLQHIRMAKQQLISTAVIQIISINQLC